MWFYRFTLGLGAVGSFVLGVTALLYGYQGYQNFLTEALQWLALSTIFLYLARRTKG